MKIALVALALANVTFAEDSEEYLSNYDDQGNDGLRQSRSNLMDIISYPPEKISQQDRWRTDLQIQPAYPAYPSWPSGSVSIKPIGGNVQIVPGGKPNLPGVSIVPGGQLHPHPGGDVHILTGGKPNLPEGGVSFFPGGPPSQVPGGGVSFVPGGQLCLIPAGGVSFVPKGQPSQLLTASVPLISGKSQHNSASSSYKDTSHELSDGSNKDHADRSAEDRRIELCSKRGCTLQAINAYPMCACNFVTGKVASFKNQCDIDKHNCRFETDFQVILAEICPWEFDSRRSMSNSPVFNYSSGIYYND